MAMSVTMTCQRLGRSEAVFISENHHSLSTIFEKLVILNLSKDQFSGEEAKEEYSDPP
jgi:hypothetical protein